MSSDKLDELSPEERALAESMDLEELKKALKGGDTMSSLAAKKGISQDDLVKTIASTLPAQGPDGP